MLRNIAAVIGGLVVGMILNMIIIQLNTSLFFPLPEGVDMNDPQQMAAYMAGLPAVAFLVAMVAHLVQAFVGGWVAARLGASRPVLLALIVAVFSMAGGIASFLLMDPPMWMAVELPLYLVAGWMAGVIERRRREGLDG